ncbi:MAG: ATP-dependent RecD-like DNA helicase, partial [Pseudomonadota bacterium]|jgi:exodeoxyribonuclease V alpha subunit|nr:ATP-dependent RecD-like DNA helicase [Pseudomonadota bacterium]
VSTVVGYSMQIIPGERLTARGRWVRNEKFGRQFKASGITREAPQDGAGLAKYMASALEGIGPEFAARLVAKFGAALPEIIEKTPERLREVEGVGKKRVAAIAKAWSAKAAEAKSLAWLCGIGLSVKQSKVAQQLYGEKARAAIEMNPYRLADDLSGLGFLKVDVIARKLGIKSDSDERVDAAILYCVQQGIDAGSCGVSAEAGAQAALKILGFKADPNGAEIVRQAIKRLAQCERIVVDFAGEAGEVCLFARWVYELERRVADALVGLRDARSPVRVEDVEASVRRAEGGLGITLDPRQREAVHMALASNVTVITGGPGTGKTTITRAIVRAFERVKVFDRSGAGTDGRRAKVLVCAPTGKAAKRASEAIGCEAVTIHRALEWGPGGPKRDGDNPIEADVLIVDEMSMVDIPLMHALLTAVPRGARLILVGDRDQLPSVGPGRVLEDLINSEALPVAKLEVVFRQAQSSQIIVNAHRVNHGSLPHMGMEGLEAGGDFGFLVEKDTEKAREQLLALVAGMRDRPHGGGGFDPVKDCQVLVPMRKGTLGTDQLNIELQRLLNPGRRLTIPFHGGVLCKGDKVIQIKNNYQKEVFNGEIGFVQEVDPRDGSCFVVYDDEKLVGYPREDLNEIRLAYALTIHKSQGSEFPVVLMAVAWEHFVMLKRNLIYTGITRAKRLMVLVGDARAVGQAVKDDSTGDRHSKLAEWLAERGGMSDSTTERGEW